MILRTIKLVVSAGLILILVWNVDWSEIHSNLSKLNTTLAVAAVLILILQYPLSAWKWQKSLALHGVKYPLGYLLRILCIAFFFNNFLPSAIGGDTYRAYRTFGHASRYAYPISAVIVERVLGLFALIFFGYMSAVVLVATGAFEFKKELTIISVGLILGAILLLAFWKIGFLERLSHRLRGLSKLEPVWESARAVRANRRHLVTLVGLSLLFQFGFTAAAAGVAGMIPLSINGIGIVEGSFAVTAVIAKLPYGDAVIVALFIRIFGLASSVIFGILYAFDRNTPVPRKKANTEK
jgi:uncharacterized membrane protein YbhN (UPF0104 family)